MDRVKLSVYRIPTEEPESDGTLTWDSTTVVVVEATAGGVTGLGMTYGPRACSTVIHDTLMPVVIGRDPFDVPGAWSAMVDAIRNMGRPGIASMAIAAVDCALWDLKAHALELPLAHLLGMVRNEVAIYGSGGFTSYSDEALEEQLGRWVHDRGIPRVKIKIGADWGQRQERDLDRVALTRKIIGDSTELFVDANGGYSTKQAIRIVRSLSAEGVTWFEEPVSSDDLDGLKQVRDATDIDVAAGEYGYDLVYFTRMAPAVDVLQIDASRCAGITEWLRACALAAGHGLEVSAHAAQSLHAHPACAVPNLRHIEYFADHERVDRLLFDGVLDPQGGALAPDLTRPGMGLELRRADADRYLVESVP